MTPREIGLALAGFWIVFGALYLVVRAQRDRANAATIADLEQQIHNNAAHWRVRGHVGSIAIIDGRPRIVLARIGEDPNEHREA